MIIFKRKNNKLLTLFWNLFLLLNLNFKVNHSLPNPDLIDETDLTESNVPLNSNVLSTPATSYLIQDSFDTFFQQQDDLTDVDTSSNLNEPFKKFSFFDDETESLINDNMNKANLSDFYTSKVKWIRLNDLIELVMYMNNQKSLKSPIPNVLIIDTRSSNEYNGWKSFAETNVNQAESNVFNNEGLLHLYDMKNGHVNSAHNFDADWIHLFDTQVTNNLVKKRYGLEFKNNLSNINEGRLPVPPPPIVLYDICKIRLGKVKDYLESNFNTDTIYMCKLENTEISKILSVTNETSKLFFQEPFFDMLLSAEALNSILRPVNESYVIKVKPIAEYKLFDVSQSSPELFYERAHIPTAVHLNTDDLEDVYTRKRKNKTEIAQLLLDCGILPNNSEIIILYGNPDPMASFRASLIMKWMGVKNVHVLNGGFHSWTIKGFPTEVYPNKRISAKNYMEENAVALFEEQSFNSQSPINYIVDFNYVNDIVKNYDVFSDHYVLVDIRSYEEHIGEKSADLDPKGKGRIPTSMWGRGGNQLEDYHNPDLTMRSGVEILKMWDELGIDYKYKHIIFYSNDAWRASEIMFYAELMGLYKISVYEGGWNEWSNNPNNSLQLGPSNDSESISFETRFESTLEATTPTSSKTTTTKLSTITSSTSKLLPSLSTSKMPVINNNPITNINQHTTKLESTRTKYPKKPSTTTRNASDFYKEQFDKVTAASSNASSCPCLISNNKITLFFLSLSFIIFFIL